jgi:hypothetical protein
MAIGEGEQFQKVIVHLLDNARTPGLPLVACNRSKRATDFATIWMTDITQAVFQSRIAIRYRLVCGVPLPSRVKVVHGSNLTVTLFETFESVLFSAFYNHIKL